MKYREKGTAEPYYNTQQLKKCNFRKNSIKINGYDFLERWEKIKKAQMEMGTQLGEMAGELNLVLIDFDFFKAWFSQTESGFTNVKKLIAMMMTTAQ